MPDPRQDPPHDPRREAPEARLGRLRMRSMRRGTREMDLILHDYTSRELAGLAPADLDAFEALLEEPDPDLLRWITGAAPPPDRHAGLVARIQAGAVGPSADR